MPETDERLRIDALGVEIVLRPSGAAEEPDSFTFDVLGHPRGFLTLPHVHPRQVERYQVLGGRMRLVTGRRTQVLEPGERAETPAGVPHRQMPVGSQPGHVRVTLAPAGETESFLRRLAAYSEQGGFNRLGLPRPVAGARLTLEFADAGHATFPPPGVQRAMARGILALAGARERLWRRYEFIDEWEVAAPPKAVFKALSDARTYPSWWRPVYLGVEADGPPAVGSVSRQHFKGWLPYHLHTTSRIVRLEPDSVIEGDVEGDLGGRGVWTLEPTQSGTHVRLEWTVHADRLLLRVLTPALRPLLRFNHRWAIERAIEGLEPYAQACTTDAAEAAEVEKRPAELAV